MQNLFSEDSAPVPFVNVRETPDSEVAVMAIDDELIKKNTIYVRWAFPAEHSSKPYVLVYAINPRRWLGWRIRHCFDLPEARIAKGAIWLPIAFLGAVERMVP